MNTTLQAQSVRLIVYVLLVLVYLFVMHMAGIHLLILRKLKNWLNKVILLLQLIPMVKVGEVLIKRTQWHV